MNNKNVIALPASTNYTPEQALHAAAQFDDLADVLIVGYDVSGDLLVRSSKMSRADAVFLLEKAKQWTMEGGL